MDDLVFSSGHHRTFLYDGEEVRRSFKNCFSHPSVPELSTASMKKDKNGFAPLDSLRYNSYRTENATKRYGRGKENCMRLVRRQQ